MNFAGIHPVYHACVMSRVRESCSKNDNKASDFLVTKCIYQLLSYQIESN